MKLKYTYLAIIFSIYFILPILILAGILDFNSKFIYLTVGAMIVYVILRFLGVSNHEMGITRTSAIKSLKDISKFTMILASIGVILYFSGIAGRFNPTETIEFYIFYVFISSPVQEFLYRGTLVKMLKEFKLDFKTEAVISSLLYSFVHIIYKDIWTLLLTFAIGLVWYKYYRKTNNLLGVSVSHAVLGAVTIVAGIID